MGKRGKREVSLFLLPSPYSSSRGTLGFAVFFLCGFPVKKIPHCSVAVISNPTVCDACAFKPMVFGETKLFATLLHQQYKHSLHADYVLWTVYMAL